MRISCRCGLRASTIVPLAACERPRIPSFSSFQPHLNRANFSSHMKKGSKGHKGKKPVEKPKSTASPKAQVQPEPTPVAAVSLPQGEYILIDGSVKEGGGQILRNTTSLAAIMGKNIRIVNIRANREKPGLKAQHMTGIQLVRDMYGGVLEGDKVNSMTVSFSPGKFVAKDFVADTKTAGAVSLLIQVALPCAVFGSAPISATLKGGTNAAMAPQIDYLTQVFQPAAERMGIKFRIDIQRRGFYPRGGGVVVLHTEPSMQLGPIEMVDRGVVRKITGRAFAAGQVPATVPGRMVKEASHLLRKFFGDSVEYEWEKVQETHQTAEGDGAGIMYELACIS